MKKFLMVLTVLCFASVSQAASINSILGTLAEPGATQQYVFSDSDLSLVLDSTGALKSTGAIVVGDFIVGTIQIESIKNDAKTSGTTTKFLGSVASGNFLDSELTGIYALEVKSITGGSVTDTIVTGSLSAADVATVNAGSLGSILVPGDGFGTGGMIALYEGLIPDYAPPAGADALDFGGAGDGLLWASYGTGLYNITAVSTDIFDAGAASARSYLDQIATLSYDLHRQTGSAFGSALPLTELLEVTTAGGLANSLSGGSLDAASGTYGTPGPTQSDLAIAAIVPVPMAAFAGLPMLAGLALLRRRRNA